MMLSIVMLAACVALVAGDVGGLREKVCDTCLHYAGNVDSMLANPSNQQKVRDTLERVCNVFSLIDSDDQRLKQCMRTVDDYVNKAMSGAVTGFEPHHFCAKIYACEHESKRDLNIDFGSIEKKVCDECHSVVGKVDTMLANPANQQKARSFLENVCAVVKVFDDAAYKNCLQKVDDAVNRVLSGAASGLEPRKFCQQIHACAAPTQRNAFTDFFSELRDKSCNQCHSTMGKLDAVLDDPKNEDKVRKFFQKFCSFHTLVKDDAGYQTCVSNVDHHVYRAMVGMAEIQLEPKKFCRQIGICRA